MVPKFMGSVFFFAVITFALSKNRKTNVIV
jgi:hypothetical protein